MAAAGVLQLSAASYDVDESTTTASFTVTRTGGSDGTVTVDISTSDGTAMAGQDYGSMTTTATFSDGDTQPKTGTFVIFNDADDEADETVTLTLSAVTGGATVGARASAVVTIIDDDPTAYALGGTVSGLAGSGLVLRNNGGGDLDIAADGSFSFAGPLAEGSDYDVTVSAQPWAPAQSCTVSNGSGVVGPGDVSDVQVSCTDAPLQTVVVRRVIPGIQTDVLAVREDGSGLAALAETTDSETFQGQAADRVIFSRNTAAGADLYSILPDGSGLVTLSDQPNSERFGGIAGNVVIFNRQAGITAATDDVYAIGADGTGLTTLAASGDDEEFRAVAASGPGERVVYSRTISGQDDLYSVNLDGSDPIAIADDANFEEFAAVTPGGRVLFHLILGSQRDLYSVNADGTGLVPLSTAAVSDEFITVLDNERVLFRREIAPFQYDLFTVNADGTAQATLADSADLETYVGHTPAGRVIFMRQPLAALAQTDLYAINADGTDLSAVAATPLTEGFVGTLPDERVVFMRYDGPNQEFSDLFIVGADGSGEAQLTNTVEPESTDFQIYTAGGRLIFMRELGGQLDLFSIAFDGTDERRLTDTAGSEQPRGTTLSGGVIYEVEDGAQTDLRRIGADGNGAAVYGATADDERLAAVL